VTDDLVLAAAATAGFDFTTRTPAKSLAVRHDADVTTVAAAKARGESIGGSAGSLPMDGIVIDIPDTAGPYPELLRDDPVHRQRSLRLPPMDPPRLCRRHRRHVLHRVVLPTRPCRSSSRKIEASVAAAASTKSSHRHRHRRSDCRRHTRRRGPHRCSHPSVISTVLAGMHIERIEAGPRRVDVLPPSSASLMGTRLNRP